MFSKVGFVENYGLSVKGDYFTQWHSQQIYMKVGSIYALENFSYNRLEQLLAVKIHLQGQLYDNLDLLQSSYTTPYSYISRICAI